MAIGLCYRNGVTRSNSRRFCAKFRAKEPAGCEYDGDGFAIFVAVGEQEYFFFGDPASILASIPRLEPAHLAQSFWNLPSGQPSFWTAQLRARARTGQLRTLWWSNIGQWAAFSALQMASLLRVTCTLSGRE